VTAAHDESDARPLVLGLVGTDHHPFDRVVAWLDAFARTHPDVHVVVQHGTSQPPTAADGVPLLPKAELAGLLDRAAVVVSHGGPSTIVESYRTGRMPVVVPRDPQHGEHVDGHQQRFARFAEQRGLALVAHDAAALTALVERGLAGDLPRPGAALPDPAHAAAVLGQEVARLTAVPSRRLRLLRRSARSGARAPRG